MTGFIDDIRFFRAKDYAKLAALEPGKRLSIAADMIRLNTLLEIVEAQSGHIGASFSAIEMMTVLYHQVMRIDPACPSPHQDKFILSKGHAAAALYAVLASKGCISEKDLLTFRKLNGLQGHADVSVLGVDGNTGSLGMGISKAKGYAWSNRHADAYVMVGDGELQEGQNWEAIMSAGHMGLGNLWLIIDRNMVQTDMETHEIMDIEPLADKFRSFGWIVETVNGHDVDEIVECFDKLKKRTLSPKAIIARTIKGKGATLFEHNLGQPYEWHSRIPSEKQFEVAYMEIHDRLQHKLDDVGVVMTMPEAIYPPIQPQAFNARPLKQAFTDSLLELGGKNTSITVMDCDLSADNGLREFERLYPARFIQCGIAEQDMVSMAGAMARNGRLPIVNTYAAFLTSRANEQIFNNCSEYDKIIYVGHLAGLLPSRPGKSHQAIRDISLLAAIPDLLQVSPCNTSELKQAMRLLVKKVKTSSYLRLEHASGREDIALPDGYKVEIGKGCIVHGATSLRSDLVIISYGPLMLSECILAAKELEVEKVAVRVINLPWLNTVDWEWLKMAVGSTSAIVCVENHSGVGGQSIMLSKKYKVHTIGVDGWTQSGGNEEVLKHYRMDHAALVSRIYEEVLE